MEDQTSINALRDHVGAGMRILSLGVAFASLNYSDNELEGKEMLFVHSLGKRSKRHCRPTARVTSAIITAIHIPEDVYFRASRQMLILQHNIVVVEN
jgi:hypothetical protein